MNTHIYHCANKKCKQYHKQFTSMSPAQARLCTGKSVICVSCGMTAMFINFAPIKSDKIGDYK